MSRRPNIVFVLTDDQGYGDLGCYGNKDIITPNIDNFYNEAVRCTDYHVGPTCAPTRAGIMTGHYANSTGVWHTIGGRSLLRPGEWTVANALGDSGYKTGIFGKWHLGDNFPYRAMDRGFQETVVHGGGGITQGPDYWGNDYFDDTYFVNGEPQRFNGYCTDVFFSEAIKFIEKNKDDPFLCFVTTNAPHTPLNVEQKYIDMYDDKPHVSERMRRFYAMITNIDENFGKLSKKIDELGIAQDTIFIFMTDNGTGDGVILDDNHFVVGGYGAGLRGKKNSEYEGGHRVPFLIRYPAGSIGGGVDMEKPCANVDLMPTFLDLCSVDVPADKTFDGMSIAKNLKDTNSGMVDRCLVTDSQRLTNPVKWRKSAVIWNDYRLVNGEELFDVKKDREQRNDIAAENPDIVAKLRDVYDGWWEKVTANAYDEIPIHITEEETYISSHDQRGEMTVFDQTLIRAGSVMDSYWEVFLPADGEYQFDVRRWPNTHARPIRASIDTPDVEYKAGFDQRAMEDCALGKALNINAAELKIGDVSLKEAVTDGMESVVFRANLKGGNYHLVANLLTEEGDTIGAYFVYAKKLA